jgi:NAD(P)-dependent dehydrogenase (short-subunit alcohol dehydrogenase family)
MIIASSAHILRLFLIEIGTQESSFLFAKHGAKVVVVDINTKRGEEVVDQIKKWGGAATFVHADVSKAADVEKMFSIAEKAYHKSH